MDHTISPNRHKKFGPTRTKDVWEKSNGHCWYCGIQLNPPTSDPSVPVSYVDRVFTMDHVTPLSKGGTKDISNLAPSCRKCNNLKGSSTVEFLRMKLLFATKKRDKWPKFNSIQYEFLTTKGIFLGSLERFEFYFERMKLK